VYFLTAGTVSFGIGLYTRYGWGVLDR